MVFQIFCIVAQKSEIPGSSKSLGKNMLQDEMQKVLPVQGAIADFAGFAFRILEGNKALISNYTAQGHKLCFTSWAGSPCHLCSMNFKITDYDLVQYKSFQVFCKIIRL